MRRRLIIVVLFICALSAQVAPVPYAINSGPTYAIVQLDREYAGLGHRDRKILPY